MKLTPAQARVMEAFRGKSYRYAHPDYWTIYDTRPLRALLAKGLLRHVAPFTAWGDTYEVTELGRAYLDSRAV